MGAYGISYGDLNGPRKVLIKDYVLERWIDDVRFWHEHAWDGYGAKEIAQGAGYIADKLAELIDYKPEG